MTSTRDDTATDGLLAVGGNDDAEIVSVPKPTPEYFNDDDGSSSTPSENSKVEVVSVAAEAKFPTVPYVA